MSGEDITIDVGMDTSAYLSGSQQIQQANATLTQSFTGLVGTTGAVDRAMAAITPKRIAIGAWSAMAYEAAKMQQSLGGLRGISSVTEISVNKLADAGHRLAREFPVGNDAAQALIAQFTGMGVSAKGSESQISALAKTTTQFAGATSTGLSAAATGMVDFSRAVGNTNLDPKRYTALSDSVTTVSATFGASASSVLAFSKNIAPMANVAGIGATGIAGISTAFARLGEDGIGANTAVNKMLTDMSRSVREGSPQLAIYSAAVGKTREQFTALYKTNPAEALTQVTEAISKSSSGPRLLEQLGLDSVRTMKALTALSSSGGLRPAIATATAAYGSGSTEKAAQSAYEGLNSEAIKLASTMQQLGESMGRPLLAPLTGLSKVLALPVRAASAVADSPVGQAATTAVVGVGLSLLALQKLLGPVSTFALGRQALTSGPVVGAAAGRAAGARQDWGRVASYGAPANRMMDPKYVSEAMPYGRLGLGPAGPANIKAYQLAEQRGNRIYEKRTLAFEDSKRGEAFRQRMNFGNGQLGPVMMPFVTDRDGITTGGGRAADDFHSAGAQMNQERLGEAMAKDTVKANIKAAGGPVGAGRVWATAKNAAFGTTQSILGSYRATLQNSMLPADERKEVWGAKKATDHARTELIKQAEGRGLTPQQIRQEVKTDQTLPKSEKVGMSTGFARAGEAAGLAYNKSDAGVIGRSTAGLQAFGNSIFKASISTDAAGKSTANLAGTAKAAAMALGTTAKAAGSMALMPLKAVGMDSIKGSLGALKGAGSAALGLVGGPAGAAMMAGMLSLPKIMENASKSQQAMTDYTKSDVHSMINTYRESIGMATAPAATVQQSAPAPLPTPAMSVASATGKMTQAELEAGAKGGKSLHDYVGKPKDIAAQIVAGSATGYTPKEMGAVRVDLLKTLSESDANAVMAALPAGTVHAADAAPGAQTGGTTTAQADAFTASVNNSEGKGGIKGWFGKASNFGDRNKTVQGGVMAAFEPGGAMYMGNLSDEAKGAITTEAQKVAAAKDVQTNLYGVKYANQQQYASADKLQKAIQGKGSVEASSDTSSKLLNQLLGTDNAAPVTSNEWKESGGSISKVAAMRDPKKFGKTYNADTQGGPESAVMQKGMSSSVLYGAGDYVGGTLFSNLNKTKTGLATQAAMGAPEDLGLRKKAAETYVTENTKMGSSASQTVDSLNGLNAALQKTINSMPEGSKEQVQAQANQAQVAQATALKEQSMTPSELSTSRTARMAAVANVDPGNSPTGIAAQQAARAGLIDQQAQDKARIVARLQLQRDADKAARRNTEDFNRSQGYAIADYNKSVARTNEAFNLSQSRSKEDYNISVLQSTQDFNKARERTNRDFNISLTRGEQDYLLSRTRAIRDFNIGVKRMIEDAASTMYDPYARIQTKATWDIANLMVNLRSQNAAMAKQKSDLDTLRKRGLSQQAIDQLSLGKAENAQQVGNLMGDTANNPAAIAALNKTIAARAKAAGALTTDPSNKELRRSKEDFAKSQNDQAKDYAKSIKRSREDLAKGLGDQAFDFARAQARNKKAFDLGQARLAADNVRNLSYMAIDNATAMSRAAKANQVNLARMAEDITDADKTINGTMEELQAALTDTLAGKSGALKKVLKNDMTDFAANLATNTSIITGALAALGIPLNPIANPKAEKAYFKSQGMTVAEGRHAGGKAEGGTIDGFSPHSKADNIPFWGTAGEFVQPVDTVKHYGVKNMEKLRTKQLDRRVFDSVEGYAAGGLLYPSMRSWASTHFPEVGAAGSPGAQWDYRPGTGTSWHAKGDAVDLSPPSMKIFDGILAAWGNKIAELIYTPAGNRVIKNGRAVSLLGFYGKSIADTHNNHVHWAMNPAEGMVAGLPVVAGGADAAAGANSADVFKLTKEMLTKGMNSKRKGVYGALYKGLLANFNKAYPDGKLMAGAGAAGGIPGGDMSASGGNAKANQIAASKLLAAFGWGQDQMSSLIPLWNGESGWNQLASNGGGGPDSGRAYGIPQSLPGNKMASAGADWRTNPITQMRWGLDYIKNRPDYGSPAKAYSMWQSRSPHWYDQGGDVPPGTHMIHNGTGKTEKVLNDPQWKAVQSMVDQEQGRSMSSAGCTYMTVNHNETITNDYRNDFGNADITVVSNNPDDMANQLSAKAVSQRLTQTRGVQWSSTPQTR